MKLQRFFGDFNFEYEEITSREKELINQLKNVFRYQKGSEVILLNGRKKEAIVEIRKITSDEVIFEIKKISETDNSTKNKVTLYCSLLKKENFELVAQKATEIGVEKITPLLSARTLKQNINTTRIEKIIKEASEQSERGNIPILTAPKTFKDILKNIKGDELNILFDHSGNPLHSYEGTSSGVINIFIGPEGGWEEYELEEANKNNFKIASLGKLNLRGETAAIVASYLAVNL